MENKDEIFKYIIDKLIDETKACGVAEERTGYYEECLSSKETEIKKLKCEISTIKECELNNIAEINLLKKKIGYVISYCSEINAMDGSEIRPHYTKVSNDVMSLLAG